MAKNWMAGAVTHPGALHRALKVPQGQKIPASKLAAAAKRGGKVAKMASLAKTFSKYRPKSRSKR